MVSSIKISAALAFFALFTGCRSMPAQPIQTVEYVDLQRFMGDWHVIAHIPTAVEKQAFNAVESYRLNNDGTIATTFTFNKGSSNGPLKKLTPKGFVVDKQSNAVWGMRLIWPIKAEYLIADLNEDYTQTIVARNKRDYVWIMARTATIPDQDYARLVEKVKALGYDVGALRKVPQRRW